MIEKDTHMCYIEERMNLEWVVQIDPYRADLTVQLPVLELLAVTY